MRKLSMWYSMGIVSLLLVFLVSPVGAQNPEKAGFEDLTLTLAAAKPQFLSLEPLTLEIEVRNNTAYTIQGHFGLCLYCERLELYQGRVGEVRTKIPKLTGVIALQTLPEKVLQPGETFENGFSSNSTFTATFPSLVPTRFTPCSL